MGEPPPSLRMRTLAQLSRTAGGPFETLFQNHGTVVQKILERTCSEPRQNAATVSLFAPDPYQCQIPLSRVTPACRRGCELQLRANVECHKGCRKWIQIWDPVRELLFVGHCLLHSYQLAPANDIARVVLLLPKGSVMSRELEANWEWESEDAPTPIESWDNYVAPNTVHVAISGVTYDKGDLHYYTSVTGYEATAYFTVWETDRKGGAYFAELHVFLDLSRPILFAHVGERIALSDKRTPRSRSEEEYQTAGQQWKRNLHKLGPRHRAWPLPLLPSRGVQKPALKAPRDIPALTDLRTRASTYLGGRGSRKRKNSSPSQSPRKRVSKEKNADKHSSVISPYLK
jgi:hypothetical protein